MAFENGMHAFSKLVYYGLQLQTTDVLDRRSKKVAVFAEIERYRWYFQKEKFPNYIWHAEFCFELKNSSRIHSGKERKWRLLKTREEGGNSANPVDPREEHSPPYKSWVAANLRGWSKRLTSLFMCLFCLLIIWPAFSLLCGLLFAYQLSSDLLTYLQAPSRLFGLAWPSKKSRTGWLSNNTAQRSNWETCKIKRNDSVVKQNSMWKLKIFLPKEEKVFLLEILGMLLHNTSRGCIIQDAMQYRPSKGRHPRLHDRPLNGLFPSLNMPVRKWV